MNWADASLTGGTGPNAAADPHATPCLKFVFSFIFSFLFLVLLVVVVENYF
jgi:hypothetical protein